MNKLTNASFSQLVVQYERLVYTVCFQLVRDAAAAEDLTQETFLSAYLHRDAIPPGYERQWLCRVARPRTTYRAPISATPCCRERTISRRGCLPLRRRRSCAGRLQLKSGT